MRLRGISVACATFNLEIAFWSLDQLAVVAARRNLPQPLARSVECVATLTDVKSEGRRLRRQRLCNERLSEQLNGYPPARTVSRGHGLTQHDPRGGKNSPVARRRQSPAP